jgi:3-oxoacyl-[acyl-carrier protein] reductase
MLGVLSMVRFEGRVALVTGGARGIGAATGHRLAAEGAAVALLDRDADTAAQAAAAVVADGGRAMPVSADVASRHDVQAAVDAVVEQYGRLDILVNNAGVIRDNLLHKMSDEDWQTVLDIHLTGAFLCSQLAVPHMRANGYGRIVSMSSIGGDGSRGQANYSAAKAGLRGFTRTLAIELGRYGITANAVAPGFISSAMTEQTAERIGMSFEDFQQAAAAATVVQRVGEPADIAAAVAFLASEEAGFISGHTLYVDGGGRV